MSDIQNASSKFHAILYADDTNLTSTLCSVDVNIDNNCTSLQLSTNFLLPAGNIALVCKERNVTSDTKMFNM